jgi:hypothetical protein
VKAVMNLRVPLNVGKFLSGCITGDLSGRAQLHEVSYLVSCLVSVRFRVFTTATMNSTVLCAVAQCIREIV